MCTPCRALNDFGVSPLVTKVGDEFDPTVHDAVSQMPTLPNGSGDAPTGSLGELRIAEILRDGYTIWDSTLRPAKVIVTRELIAASPQDAPDGTTPLNL